jgi:hypothetical protein
VRLLRVLPILLAVSLLAACPGKAPARRADARVTSPGAADDPDPWPDGSTYKPADSTPSVKLDGGSGGVTGTMSCSQIYDCMMACTPGTTEDACYQGCYDQGSARGQSQYDAFNNCEWSAFEGSCASVCTSDNDTCWNCCDTACASQIAACQ